jgi:hypothetical protein
MALYQPSQRLTWRYDTSSGQLSIISEIAISLGSGESVLANVSAIRNYISVITLNVGSASSSLVQVIPVEVIDTGLNSLQVRGILKTLDPVTVIATCYKDNNEVGEVVTITSASSDVEVL